MKKVLLLLAFIGTGSAWAQTPAATATPSPKPTSSFSFSNGARNPFWPIGWQKKPKAAPVAANTTGQPVAQSPAPLKASDFKVTSISLQPFRMAIINGKECLEGDSLRHSSGPVRLIKVRDGDVVLRNEAGEVVVPLQTQ